MANTLNAGDRLNPGQSITSSNGRYVFIYQGDGNLVLYISGGIPLWDSKTTGKSLGFCIMQGDGNLVLYGQGGQPHWYTNTQNNPGSRLIVQDDGNLVIRGPTNIRHWQSRVKGFADIHNHQFANLGFGGAGALFGGAFGEISSALPWCRDAHGGGGIGDLIDKAMSFTYFGSPRLGHKVGGYPEFDGWPRWDSFTHQSVYEDWLERAVEGGLRLMVMFAVNSEFMCSLIRKASGRTCKDMEAVDYQIKAAYEMQAHIDNKKGGPGKGWYRIVKTPDEAQAVIHSGKLAVVLGIEVDYLFESYVNSGLTEAKVRSQLDKYYQMGVRHIFPIHFSDNAFGGASFDKNILQYDPKIEEPLTIQFPGGGKISSPYKIDTEDASGPPYNYTFKKGRMNVKGLTSLGKFLIKLSMDKGIIIDVDHTSYKSRSDILDIAKLKNCPVVSGHTGFVEISNSLVETTKSKRHEGNLLSGEIERIRSVGGMVAIIPHQGTLDQINTFFGAGATKVIHSCGNSSETVVQAYLYAVMRMKGGPVAFGTDFNGFAGLPGPRFGPESCPGDPEGMGKVKSVHKNKISYPFIADASGVSLKSSKIGDKVFDFNTEGLAHVGMLPDLIADFKALGLTDSDLSPLIYSAQGYVDVWRKVAYKVPEPESPNKSKFVSQTVSLTMEPGQTQSVSITMENIGTSTWKKSSSFRLGSQALQDNTFWGLNRIELPADITPGGQVTFRFNIIAPSQGIGAGITRYFQWKMVQEGIEWFGDTNPPTNIRIAPKQGTMTTVPSVRELSWDAANKMILDAFLTPNFTGTKVPGAWVDSQFPKEGTTVVTGTTVKANLRTGPIP